MVEDHSPPTLTAKKKSINSIQDKRDVDLDGMDEMEDINQKLTERGLIIRLAYAETVTKANGAETASGQTILANDRTKRLGAQWVPGDERRNADDNNLTYLTYGPFARQTMVRPINLMVNRRLMHLWIRGTRVKKNTKLDIVKREDTGVNPSAILGGDPFLADITEFGFVPGLFFEFFVGPGSSNNVLGVTFTFVFIDEAGNPTNVNNDGYEDIALKEVWYNDALLWTDSGNSGNAVDIESIALHENGHALGFGHFGKISTTENNEKLHVSPRAP